MDNNWDLTKIFKNNKEYNECKKEVNNITESILKYKGHIMDNSNNLYELLELDSKCDYLIEKMYVYSFLGYYDDMSNKDFINYKEEVLSLINNVSEKTSFIRPELLSSSFDKVLSFIKENNKLEKYKLSLERVFRYKKYTLSDKEERIISMSSDLLRLPDEAYSILNNVDVKFDNIKDEKGSIVPLTQSNYSVFLVSKNAKVRKNAFNKMYKFYKEHINTLSSLYIGNIKNNEFIRKVRGYDSVLSMHLYPDEISEILYNNLISITNENIKLLKDFYKYKTKKMGYKLHMYDLYVNTSKMIDKKIEYKDAIKIVNNALKPLGEDYLKKFNHLLNNRCVDVYSHKNKRSGAYEWGVYGIEPYVSLNYENNINSVSTLIHEMGHAMHTYLSDENQDYLYAGYPIFLAEIASTVNEVLLSEYLINNTDDKDEKIYYLVEFLDKFKATVYRQVMFSEFENTVHNYYEKGIALNVDVLNNLYLDLNKKHFAPVVKVDDDIKYEWARIPHFYTSFYVYKYATGFISALLIANKLLHEDNFKEKYIKFLSSGHIKSPLVLLKELGIDLEQEDTLRGAFDIFKEKLDLLKSLENGE